MYASVSLLNDISRDAHNIDYTGDLSREEYFWILKHFLIFMDFYGFYIFLFSFLCIVYVQRIFEAIPSLISSFLKTLKCIRRETLHTNTRENEFESFSWKRLSKDVSQLIFCLHEVELHHPLFNLFSYEVMLDVNVLGSVVLDIVAAQSNSTFVVTI